MQAGIILNLAQEGGSSNRLILRKVSYPSSWNLAALRQYPFQLMIAGRHQAIRHPHLP